MEEVSQWLELLGNDGFTYDCRSLKSLLQVNKHSLFLTHTKSHLQKKSNLKWSIEHNRFMSPTTSRLTRLSFSADPRVNPIASQSRRFHISNFSAIQIAHHLHLIEFELFGKIQVATEFKNLAWTKEDRKELAPNVIPLINRFNSVAYWVATRILTASTAKKQVSRIVFFISVAIECYKRHNFNSLMEILAGLNNFHVGNLVHVWEVFQLVRLI